MAEELEKEETESTDEEVAEAPAEESPKEDVEPEPEGEPEPKEETPEPEPAAEEPESEKPVSKRESLRIQQLIAKMKGGPQEQQKPAVLDYNTALDADPETVKTLEEDRQAYGQARESEGLKRTESILFHTRLEIDAPKAEAKFAFLDKTNSEKFNPAAANAINEWYLRSVGYDSDSDTVQNPNIRYFDFVEGLMELADDIAGEKVAASSKNIAKQAAATGLRPDGSQAKRLDLNKSAPDMTDEELEAMIAKSLPTK